MMFECIKVDYTKNPLSDKVILPQQILEELIGSGSHDVFDESKPLTLIIDVFRKEDGERLRSAVVGVREFSLLDINEIVVPWLVAYKLGILDNVDCTVMDYKLLRELPNGTSIELEPLGAIKWENLINDPVKYMDSTVDNSITRKFFFDELHVRSFLEARWNNTLTSVVDGEYMLVSGEENGRVAKEIYKFKIHRLEPAKIVCVVNTDLDLNIIGSVEVPVDARGIEGTSIFMDEDLQELQLIDASLNEPISVQPGQKVIYRVRNDGQVRIEILSNDMDESFQLMTSPNDLVRKECFTSTTLLSASMESKEGINSGSKISLTNADTSYILPFYLSKPSLSSYSFIVVTDDLADSKKSIVDENLIVCQSCKKGILKDAYLLHELHCQRSTKICTICNKKYLLCKKIPEQHWHCNFPSCGSHGDTDISYQSHLNWFHESATCTDCDEKFPNLVELSRHRSSSCPKGLHYCQFCHLIVPRGESNIESKYFNLSGHEYRCGTKTIDCEKCGRSIRKLEIASHLSLHALDRKVKARSTVLRKCSNENCSRVGPSFNNLYNLCDACFGPFYSTDDDKNGRKFKSRIERRYVIQLSRGCGFSFCKNPECKSSGLISFPDMKALINHVNEDLLNRDEFRLCVDESNTKRKLLGDIFYETQPGKYSIEWVYKAAYESSANDLETLHSWLAENAVTEAEE